ncbi:hypothetical protein ILUMI_18703 [Ignelater luminosus]|uniref:Uncharacterized protein n=1 Tax=Ignelater luminosus TaxID=2038154 RepID=A0A8K0CPK6_IGNLU|nr:hypothetical protein ILUMI_18703 [Ignelater luminosus]
MNLLLFSSFILYIFPQFVVSSTLLSDPLMVKIRETEEDRKIKLLTEYVALELGYNSTNDNNMNGSSTEQYVKQVAEVVLYDYDLTIEQKANALKIKHILEVFKTACLYEEHIDRAIELDNEAVASNGVLNGSAHDRYIYEEHLIDILVFYEGHVATDLLIQSFAPNNIYAERHVFGNDTANIINERNTQSVRRATGTLNLVNKFFDPEHRLNIDADQAAKLEYEDLYQQIEKQAIENFEKMLKLPDQVVEGTTNKNPLPTEILNVTPFEEFTTSTIEQMRKTTPQEDESTILQSLTEPPAEASEPPVEASETTAEVLEPPAKASEPPVEASETPVEASETPVEASEPPGEASESPSEASTPPVKASELPVEATRPPADDSQREVEASPLPVDATQPPTEGSQPASEMSQVDAAPPPAEDASSPAEAVHLPAEDLSVPTEPAELSLEPAELSLEPALPFQ